MNVLLIDDSDQARAILAAQLTEAGVLVIEATDRYRAAALSQGEVDLVLVDLHLAGARIVDVLRELRRARPGVPVVVVTSHPYVDEVAVAFKAGAHDVLVRPVEREVLLTALREAAGADEEVVSDDDVPIWRALVHDIIAVIRRGDLGRGRRLARRALMLWPERPEAYNLLGAIAEQQRGPLAGQPFYRAALDLDPTFVPARANLERTTSVPIVGPPALGDNED